MGSRTPAPLGELGLARGYAALIGVILVVIGVVGFFDNPIVGDPGADPLFVTGTVHNMVHLALGFLALYIAFATVGRAQADDVTGLGILCIVLLVLTVLSPNLFGILGPSPGYNVNLPGHLLHVSVGLLSVAVGIVARREVAAT